LAKKAFPQGQLTKAYPTIDPPGSTIKAEETCMVLPPGLVSRKAQFAPAFFDAMASEFVYI